MQAAAGFPNGARVCLELSPVEACQLAGTLRHKRRSATSKKWAARKSSFRRVG